MQLELTESVLLGDSAGPLQRARELKDSEVRIADDDFGIGFSLLSYMKKLPLDELKINQSFVAYESRNII